jgi:hypothetical protein
MRTLALLALAAASLLLAACASSTVTKTGPTSYAPLAPMAKVAVFTAESQVGQPLELVATISYTDPGKYAIKSLSDSFEPLRAKAREVGANGVIIDNSYQVISGIISRGISVDARAIRMATPAAAAGTQGAAKDAAEALRELQKLHQDGVITDREYEQKKAEVLRRM